MTTKDIKKMPTVLDNNHESVLRVYQILDKVKNMLNRGDSNETIIEIIEHLEKSEVNTTK